MSNLLNEHGYSANYFTLIICLLLRYM